MKKFYFYFILIFPIIFSNAQMVEFLPAFEIFSIFNFLPKEIKYIEVLIIIYFFLYSIINSKRRTNNIPLLLFIISFLGIVSFVFNSTNLMDMLQSIYSYIFPFMILFTIYHFNYDILWFYKFINFLKNFVIISFIVALYQIINYRILGNAGNANLADVVNTFFVNSHVSSFYFYLVSMIFLSVYIIKREKSYLYYIIISLFIAFFGFNEKVLFVFILFAIIFIMMIGKNLFKNFLFKLSFFIIIIFLSTFLLKNNENPNKLIRYELLQNIDFKNSGPIKAYSNIFNIYNEFPYSILIGIGPGSFSHPLVYRRFREDREVTKIAYKYNYDMILLGSKADWLGNLRFYNINISSALDWNVNLIAGYIIEFGLLSSIILFLLYKNLLSKLLSIFKKSKNQFYKSLSLALFLELLLIIFIGAISNTDNINEISLMAIIILPTAILIRGYENKIYFCDSNT